MSFQIAGSVLPLAIWLIDRLAVDTGTRGTSATAMCIDIVYLNEQTGIRHVHSERRVEVVLRCYAMQPDGSIAGANLAVDRLPVRRPLHAARNKSECLNQEVVCGSDVLVREDRDDPFEGGHVVLGTRPGFSQGGWIVAPLVTGGNPSAAVS